MENATLRGEAADFETAAKGYAAGSDRAKHIETMIALALEAVTLPLRRWASAWLLKTCSITVMVDEAEDHGNAAPTETAHLR